MSEYISREAAKDNVSQFLSTHAFVVLPELRKSFDKIPSADVRENVHGEWKRISPAGIYECSCCGQNVMTSDIECYKFCHGCGTRMRGGE